MNFFEQYTITGSIEDDFSIIDNVKAGIYNDVVKVLRKNDSERILDIWNWMFKSILVPVASNMFGDLFLVSRYNGKIYFFQPQGAVLNYLCGDLDTLFNDALFNNSIIEGLLKKTKLQTIYKNSKPVGYEEIFILSPWKILGGNDNASNYKSGNQIVYHDLVSQTLKKCL